MITMQRHTISQIVQYFVSEFCVDVCIVDGDWNAWSDWGACSVTCEQGIQIRTRVCDYPPPLRGGAVCQGDAQQSKQCVMDPCPS